MVNPTIGFSSSATKTILITGCASGIGDATAQLARLKGMKVIGFDIHHPENPEAFDFFFYCDLSEPQSIDEALAKLPSKIDYLVNSAGVPGGVPLETLFRVNVFGLRHLTATLLPQLNDNGSVVSVASGAGLLWTQHLENIMALLNTKSFEDGLNAALQDAPNDAEAYNFTKEIIIVLTKLLSTKEWARNINVNCVSPGGVETQMIPQFRETMGPIVDWSPNVVGRHAQPMDIAKPILWLLSEDAAWINGADLVADGGLLAGIQTGEFTIPEH